MNLPYTILSDRNWRVHLTILDFAILLAGIVFSPPLLSIGLIGICVIGILDPSKGVNPEWRKQLKTGLQDPFNWAVAMLYFILLVSIWQTEDWPYYFERLRIKSALLAVPIGWWGLPRLRIKEKQGIMAFLVFMMSFVGLGVLINYGLDYEVINQAIKEGRSIPVPRNHIRFSIMVALATVTALELGRQQAFNQKRLWICLALLLFSLQHLLAVRSGLVCAYLGVFVMIIVDVINSKKWKTATVVLLFLAAAPVIAYATMPSLRGKIDYMRYEMWRKQNNLESTTYSDDGRFTSIRLGLDLFQSAPLVGVGMGNLRQEMNRIYAKRYPQAEAKRPHNQFVSVLAGGGLLLFIPFAIALMYLLIGGNRWKSPAFTAVWFIVIASCMVENTLENSAGIGIFCFFIFFYGKEHLSAARVDR